jgi:phosphosulfolactate synthase (CoM biosynthesis protein A)
LLKLCHEHDVLVSTGGFIEYVLTHGRDVVDKYIEECKRAGFDIIEISCGFLTIPADDLLQAKPEIGIQFGAGGATRAQDLEAGTRDQQWSIQLARRF